MSEVTSKTHRPAIWSFVLGLIGVISLIVLVFFSGNNDKLVGLSAIVFVITAFPAIILAIYSLIKIRKSNGALKGKTFAIIGGMAPCLIILGVIILAIIVEVISHIIFG